MDLPHIFKPNIDKEINNNSSVYCSFSKDEKPIAKSSNQEKPLDTLNRLSNGGSYLFNKKVRIVTNDKVYNTKIAGKLGDYIITLDNDSILINDILSIDEI